jgi:glycosyltransferase involved in cell wall biosynthesis
VRLLYIHQFFAMRDSSHPTRSYEFARRMVGKGHAVTMVTGSSRLPDAYRNKAVARFEVDGIEVLSARNTYSNYMNYPSRILSFARFMILATWLAVTAPRPDIVFATSTPLTVAVPGYLASRLRRRPYVFEVRDPWPDAAFQMGALSPRSFIGRLAKWLERFTYRSADEIVALSPGMVEFVLAEGAAPSKVHMIPNCADVDLFHPGPKDHAIETRYGLEGKVVVGYTGAIGPSNAVHVIAEAARLLKERDRDDITIVLAGDGKCRPDIERTKDQQDLGNLLILGSVPKSEMPALLRTCDILLAHLAKVPVLYTGSPNKLFDALATGRPIIVNSPGWTKPLVEDHGAGVFVEPEDATQLADAIEMLADDPAGRERMGANARRLAEQDFNRDFQADRLIALLDDVVASRSAVPASP